MSFLLSSQPPTPPFLHDSSTSEEQDGERESGGEGEEGKAGKVEQEGEGDEANGSHSPVSVSNSLSGGEATGSRQKRSAGLADNCSKSSVDHSESKPNGISLGVQISSIAHSGVLDSRSPSSSWLMTPKHTSSPARSGAALIDFSSPSPPHLPPPPPPPPADDDREWRPLEMSGSHSTSLSLSSTPNKPSMKGMLL